MARQDACSERTLQRGETKVGIAVAAKHELDEAVAQSADAVVEDDKMHGILTTLALYKALSIIWRTDVSSPGGILELAFFDHYLAEAAMSAKETEMMGLLQELALMKEQDAKYESGPKDQAEIAEFENRKHRRRQISQQIVALGGTAS